MSSYPLEAGSMRIFALGVSMEPLTLPAALSWPAGFRNRQSGALLRFVR
jgi:hypothetical protein